MNYDPISEPLQRPLKSGWQYDKLIPFSDCAIKNLGNGRNDTREGVEMMAEMIRDFSNQTAKVAKKLKGPTLFESVQNVYDFLYNHIQYKIDGDFQDLRKPACAWAQRKTGLDCKSYTVFALSLLREMGITGAITRVRQYDDLPGIFTHVYVTVPIDQNAKNFEKELKDKGKYLVIDATRHVNEEVSFLEKKNKIMQSHQYRALGAPRERIYAKGTPAFKNALNSCGRLKPGYRFNKGGRTISKAMSAPTGNVTQNIWDNFKNFVLLLEKKGVSVNRLKSLVDYMKTLVSQGYNPYLAITPTGINVSATKGAKARFFPIAAPQRGMNGWIDDIDIIPGVDVGTATGAIGEIGGLIDDIGGFFGNLFSNIDDFIRCPLDDGWMNKSRTKSELNNLKSQTEARVQAFENAANAQNWPLMSRKAAEISAFLDALKNGYQIMKNHGWSNCTEDNLQTMINKVNELRSQVPPTIQDFLNQNFDSIDCSVKVNGHTLFGSGPDCEIVKIICGDLTGFSTKETASGSAAIIEYVPKNSGTNPNQNTNPGNTNQNNNGQVVTVPNNTQPSQAGFGTTLLWGAAIVAGLVFAAPGITKMISEEKAAAVPAKPKKTTKK